MKLSVIDLQWPGHMPALVHELERLGYYRYWVTEHYSPKQSASPTILAALAAGLLETDRMRTGTAGVLLNFQSPLAVASDFSLLELFFPGRIDLGIAGTSMGANPRFTAILDGRPAPDSRSYAHKIRELTRLVRRQPAADGGLHGNEVGPYVKTVPDIWLCGLSFRSAQIAGELGLSYAFHDYLHRTKEEREPGASIVGRYLEAFRPTPHMAVPQFNVACYGICAQTEARAQSLWEDVFRPTKPSEERVIHPEPISGVPRPSFIGTPEQCREQLLEVRERYQVQEIAISSLCNDLALQIESYRLLAETLDLERPSVSVLAEA